MSSTDLSTTVTGLPDWLDSRNGGQQPTKTPGALFKWVLESLHFNQEATSRRDVITWCLARTSLASVDTLLTELRLEEAAPSKKGRNKAKIAQKYLTARIMAELAELGKLNSPQVKDDVIHYTIQCFEYWRHNPEQDQRPEERDSRKLNFVRLVVALVRNTPEPFRSDLFPSEQRTAWISLFGAWAINLDSKENQTPVPNSLSSLSPTNQITTLSCMSLIARCSVLIAGSVELDSKFSRWLCKLLLLEENDQIVIALQNIPSMSGSVNQLIVEFISALIRSNRDQLNIISKELITRCYMSDNVTVNSRAFLSLAAVIGSESWEAQEQEQLEKCAIELLVLALANMASDLPQVSQSARLFAGVLANHIMPTRPAPECSIEDYPEQIVRCLQRHTYAILNEIFTRLRPLSDDDKDSSFGGGELEFFYEWRLLSLIIPWLKNIKVDDQKTFSSEIAFLFNNLLFCTFRFGRRHPTIIKRIWSALAGHDSNALLTINLINALCRLDNLDPFILELIQEVVGEIALKADCAFDLIIAGLANHSFVAYQIQSIVESPHWTLKKTKTDSPNGSVNSGKLDGSGNARPLQEGT